MLSSVDATSRPNTWTTDEFAALVGAWEFAAATPRRANESLHDAVYRRFVLLCGGSTRRNKAALVSKRSALKFSYLFVRDFDREQRRVKAPTFFELPPARRAEVLKSWKQLNSSVVEITLQMFLGLGRIVNKGGEEEVSAPALAPEPAAATATAKTRPEPPVTRESVRPSRASAKVLGKRKQASTARSISNPWSTEEMLQLVEAWGEAAKMLCESTSAEPLSMVHEMYRQFETIQGGKPSRNMSGTATRRRVLRQSYFRVQEFNQIQQAQGDVPFAELPLATRQSVMRGWKNSNLIDLPAELYDALEKVIPLDSRAVALEDKRRTKAGVSKVSNPLNGSRRKAKRPPKKTKVFHGEPEDEEGSASESSKWSIIVDSDEEKAPISNVTARPSTIGNEVKAPAPVVASTLRTDQVAEPADTESRSSTKVFRPSADGSHIQEKAIQAVSTQESFDAEKTSLLDAVQVQGGEKVLGGSVAADIDRSGRVATLSVVAKDLNIDKSAQSATSHNFSSSKPVAAPDTRVDDSTKTIVPVHIESATVKKKLSKAKRQRKMTADGPNGKTWDNHEIEVLVKAWEKAAHLLLENPAVSLNKEMYRGFVEMQGGSSVRNITSLAARRSSLKFSFQHIFSFNKAQKLKGKPSYHEIPQEIRMSVLRSWKNRNSVDLSKETFDTLDRIIAMDDRITQARALHRSITPRPPKKPKPPVEHHQAGKTAKWTTEETSDLIKACADVMNVPNVPSDKEQTATERESLIYDHFVIRRQNAGDTDTPVRRDLRAMAQQWRYILSSYAYIKTCNDKAAEMDSSSWFEMSPAQKRAYQQCTNVPLKFVDLDADMFALITETSFDGVVSAPLPSPATKNSPEGISLRPRETLKKTKDPYLTSDSESSVAFKPRAKPVRAKRREKDPMVKKGNSWPSTEVWNLVKAWEEGSSVSNNSRLASSVETVYERFTKLQEGPLNRNRSIHSVRNKMIALKSSFLGVANSIKEKQGDSSVWFDMPPKERMEEIRGWKNKTVMDLNKELYEALERILPKDDNSATIPGTPKEKHDKHMAARPKRELLDESKSKHQDEKRHIRESRADKLVVDWTEDELLKLASACGELLEGRRTRRYLFEEEKDRFFRRYQELGGGNPLSVAVSRARYLMDSYEFIYAYNEEADTTSSLSWFELDPTDRQKIARKVSKVHRNFNGLGSVDAELFDAVDEVDEILRQKLNETKRKTYKPPTDAASGTSRYVDPEVVVQSCLFRKRKRPTAKKVTTPSVTGVPIELGLFSSSSSSSDLSSSSESSSADDDSASDYRDPTSARSRPGAPVARAHTPSPRPTSVRARVVPPSRKRTREADDDSDGSSTLYIAEIIQQQTRKLEKAVKRFRKDSSDARKEHHEFLLRKIQDSFPLDNGNGSYLERVAERQGQSLVEIFQRLQQQRDAEKAKDRELMRQLFGRSELA